MEVSAPHQTITHPQAGTTDALLTQVEDRRREIRADGYAMSVGELASLYSDGEMIINPRFQRFFRWTDERKTALVESILLGIPLPPIFVSIGPDGVWEVVGGLRRMSTIFQAMGKLRPEHGAAPLKFTKARYLGELEGRGWEDLPKPLQLDFRRAKIHVSIILRGGDRRAQYDLFERLNTGGSLLSEQEARNCLLVMENEAFFNWLEELSEHREFQECVAVGDRLENEGYHKELVSRFLIFSGIREEELKGIGDIGPFVNDRMLEMAGEDSARLDERARVFMDTFAVLGAPTIGDRAFKRHSAADGRFKGSFLTSPFEAAACGIAHHLSLGAGVNDFPADAVLRKIEDMWASADGLRSVSGIGFKAASRLLRTIPYGRERFRPGA